MGDKPPILVCPYDAELFGHWWFEGPEFLGSVLRIVGNREDIRFCTPLDYLHEHPVQQVARPSASSWGHQGYGQVWLDESNDWLYPHLHWATGEMIALAEKYPVAHDLELRLLNQAARELMLLQASDWAFIMNTATAVEYATRRTEEHLEAFRRLRDQILSSGTDTTLLETLEDRHNLFGQMDYRVYREDYSLTQ